ncbi:MAG: hypothetical protein QM533_01595 [Cytophagales bacterium]|nr:hypothetical protein [Cytophagales bacterium]
MNQVILIVEGEDEKDIVHALAEKHAMTTTWLDANDKVDPMAKIRILVQHRVSIRKAILDAAADQYVQKIGVIYDSEEKPDVTAKELESLRPLTKRIRPDIQYQILQLPSPTEAGSLEKICLNTIDANDPLLICSHAFIDCIDRNVHKLSTTALRDKARFTTWYGAKTGKQISRLGIDVRGEKILNLDHVAFAPIVTFLKQLVG